jgi:hypothetical protein
MLRLFILNWSRMFFIFEALNGLERCKYKARRLRPIVFYNIVVLYYITQSSLLFLDNEKLYPWNLELSLYSCCLSEEWTFGSYNRDTSHNRILSSMIRKSWSCYGRSFYNKDTFPTLLNSLYKLHNDHREWRWLLTRCPGILYRAYECLDD